MADFNFALRIESEELHKELKKLAQEDDRSLNNFINRILKKHIKENKENDK